MKKKKLKVPECFVNATIINIDEIAAAIAPLVIDAVRNEMGFQRNKIGRKLDKINDTIAALGQEIGRRK